jgi:hypothetical protein
MSCSLYGLHSLEVHVIPSEQVRDMAAVDHFGLERLAMALVTCLSPSQILTLLGRLEDEFRMMIVRRSYQEGAQNDVLTLALIDPQSPTVVTRYVTSREDGEALVRGFGHAGAEAVNPTISGEAGPDLELESPGGWDDDDEDDDPPMRR